MAAQALVAAGVDVVSTANNHSLDRGALGVERTLEVLGATGLQTTGTRARTSPESAWGAVVVERAGWRVAWLACTFSTNGIPDTHRQVRPCSPAAPLLEEIRHLASDDSVDAIIVTPHVGVEYTHRPLKEDRDRAKQFIDAGATAVLAAHPHVVQPVEQHCTPNGRQGVLVHSIGNFVSGQFHRQATRAGLLVDLELRRTPTGPQLHQVRAIPLQMVRDAQGPRVQEAQSGSWEHRHVHDVLGLSPEGVISLPPCTHPPVA